MEIFQNVLEKAKCLIINDFCVFRFLIDKHVWKKYGKDVISLKIKS
jgi:hypothetical protein